jgi:hypothetical protein
MHATIRLATISIEYCRNIVHLLMPKCKDEMISKFVGRTLGHALSGVGSVARKCSLLSARVILAIAVSSQLGSMKAMSAPQLFFTPQGGQLDKDPILDIALGNPDNITFEHLITLFVADGRIDGVRFSTFYDSQELTKSNIDPGKDKDLFSNNDSYHEDLGVGLDRFTHLFVPGFVVDSVFGYKFVSASSFGFVVNNTNTLVNDGVRDYGVFDFEYLKHGKWVPVGNKQEVEAQPVPAPVAIAVFGPVMVYFRRLRAKSRMIKSIAINKLG